MFTAGDPSAKDLEDVFLSLEQLDATRQAKMEQLSVERNLGGDSHLAQDVAQLVFTQLARNAKSLFGQRALAGWLFREAFFSLLTYADPLLIRSIAPEHMTTLWLNILSGSIANDSLAS